jgi:hypothetical protein
MRSSPESTFSVRLSTIQRETKALGPVVAHDAEAAAELVVDQERERAVVVVEGAETVGDPARR